MPTVHILKCSLSCWPCWCSPFSTYILLLALQPLQLLCSAIENSDVRQLRQLLDWGAGADAVFWWSGESALMRACACIEEEEDQAIFGNSGEGAGAGELTVHGSALGRAQHAVVALLLSRGANVDGVNPLSGETAAHAAVRYNSLAAFQVRFLLALDTACLFLSFE